MRLCESKYLVILLTLATLSPGIEQARAAAGMTNRLIVRFNPATAENQKVILSDRRMQGLRQRSGIALQPLRNLSRDTGVLSLPDWVSEAEASAIAAQLQEDPSVRYAVPDRLKQPAFVPSDTFYSDQWNLFEPTGGANFQNAWDRERGDPGIVIALVDTGNLPHRDLDPGRSVPGYDFISNVFIANDGDGRDPDPADPGDWVTAADVANQPFCTGAVPEPSSWHGSQTTGIIAATADNALDIAGINHRSRILMARALGRCGGFTSDIIDATRWAAGLSVAGVPDNPNPARVINLSFGGAGPCSAAEQDAIDDVTAAGAVVIVAAGNEGGDVANSAPANCNNVIAVAATTRAGAKTSYTNAGANIDVSAPGGDTGLAPILSLFNGGTTAPGNDALAFVAGTSIAAAHVSGLASLLLSANSALQPRHINTILRDTARPFPDASCNTSICGAGIIDALAAVLVAPGFDTSDSSTGGGGSGGSGCTLATAPATPDPLLWLMPVAAALWVRRRWRQGVDHHLA